jgi:2-iminobutanoate/2-iminopropanoate deaminase
MDAPAYIEIKEATVPTFLNPPGGPGEKYGLSSGAAAGDYVFAAGMALDFGTLKRRSDAVSVSDEVRLCLDSIERVLGLAGATLGDIVKTTCWLSDESDRAEFLAAYKHRFGDGPYPARATLVAGLAGECRVQIDALAMRSAGH